MIPSVIVPVNHKEVLAATKTTILGVRNKVAEFEQLFSTYVGSKYAISTYSGLSALYVLLKAYGLRRGDKVIMPAYMCESVGRLILDMNYTLKFVDVEKDTYNIDIEDLSMTVDKDTKAIIAVHMFGNPCRISEIRGIAEDYKTIVLEDSAQCIGAEHKHKKVGTIGDSAFFSLGEGKPITTLNGGMIVTNDEGIATKSRNIIDNFNDTCRYKNLTTYMRLLSYSIIKNQFVYGLLYDDIVKRRISRREKLKTSMSLDRLTYKFTEMQASMGIVQLSKLDRFNKVRKRNAEFLIKHLNKMDNLCLPKITNNDKPIFLRLPVHIEGATVEKRNRVLDSLMKSGIDASATYPNVLPEFFGIHSECPKAKDVVEGTITLPVHPYVKENDLWRMVDTLGEVIT